MDRKKHNHFIYKTFRIVVCFSCIAFFLFAYRLWHIQTIRRCALLLLMFLLVRSFTFSSALFLSLFLRMLWMLKHNSSLVLINVFTFFRLILSFSVSFLFLYCCRVTVVYSCLMNTESCVHTVKHTHRNKNLFFRERWTKELVGTRIGTNGIPWIPGRHTMFHTPTPTYAFSWACK